MIISEPELVFVIGHTTILLDGHCWFEGLRNYSLRGRFRERP